jgi:hypothetical protein
MAQRSQRTFPVLRLMTFAHHKIFASHLNGLKAERLECPRSPKPQDQRGENQQKQDGAEKEGDGRNHPDRRFFGHARGLVGSGGRANRPLVPEGHWRQGCQKRSACVNADASNRKSSLSIRSAIADNASPRLRPQLHLPKITLKLFPKRTGKTADDAVNGSIQTQSRRKPLLPTNPRSQGGCG